MSEQEKPGLEQQLAGLDLKDKNLHQDSPENKKRKNEKSRKFQLKNKQEGKFLELPGAEMGKVVVRFPPEASGYLHIGHSKAALLNQHYQLTYNGRLIMRFDDTNPAKEKEDFEKVILEDVDLLKIKPDRFTYTSDYFDKMLEMCEDLLKQGLAFVDDTEGNQMRLEREQRINSVNRNNSIDKNLSLWKHMLMGSEIGVKCCVRAKIDMNSANGCMRDPTIYRCKPEYHPRTFDTYKVYPTYDFACPIVDSLEGVTHSLRTTEYLDRDEQFYWFCDALKLGTKDNETKPVICSYSRLNMTNTVLSKRKLTWFVDHGHVDGWDDPRMPTVRGVLRRGMQIDALKQFIMAQGSSRTVTAMQWDKIWSLNRSIIDSVAPRHTAILVSNPNDQNTGSPVEVLVENVDKPYKINNVAKHPKNAQLGLKNCVWATPKILIDYSDSELLKEGSYATFINWGNLLINRIERNQNNEIKRIYAMSDSQNTDFKSTVKITWLPNINSNSDENFLPLIPVVCVYFDHLISKPVLEKDDDFKHYLTQQSRWELQMLGDSELKDLHKGDVIQLQRKGFFICDSQYQPYSIHTGKECPVVLFNIPDGRAKTEIPINNIESNTIEVTTSRINDQSQQSVDILVSKINSQGNLVRSMKSNNASKAEIGEAVKILLSLKAEYKNVTGTDFKPSESQPIKSNVASKATTSPSKDQSQQSDDILVSKINSQGNLVRSMKSNNASKAEIGEAVKILLSLKAEYKNVTGTDFKPSESQPIKSKPKQEHSVKSNVASKIKMSKNQEKTDNGTNTKKITKLGLEVPKVAENLGLWYSQVLVKGEMIEYYDVSGCYILRPWAFRIWELLKNWFDSRIKRHPLSVQNCYFPIFVSKTALEKEKDHISDFAPEVAWVTKYGESDLAENIAIRPTSETVMYPSFSKWIQSYRDLPLKLNQWNNVVRWEFKHPQPFLRTREFLWQEGHHAYATQEEAERDVLITLDYYEYIYKNMLSVPVIKGKKTEKEKFAGGVFTTTCEVFIASSGRAIQGATSHYLGTNFARMFDVHYEDPDTHERLFVHQISYGMTTRTIGVMVMVHGDDRGLVLPPRIATLQVIIVPCGIGINTPEEIKQNLIRTCLEVCNRLKGIMNEENNYDNSVIQKDNPTEIIRADTDLRENYSPGWKFNHWELKGVPLRLELGPKDLSCGQITAVRRDNGEKLIVPLDKFENGGTDNLISRIAEILNQIQNDMLVKAQEELKQNVIIVRQWSECATHLANKRLLLIPFCGNPNCEDNIKRDTTKDDGTAEIGASVMGAKSLCVPFEQPQGKEKLKCDDKCIHPECGQLAGSYTLFGRSY